MQVVRVIQLRDFFFLMYFNSSMPRLLASWLTRWSCKLAIHSADITPSLSRAVVGIWCTLIRKASCWNDLAVHLLVSGGTIIRFHLFLATSRPYHSVWAAACRRDVAQLNSWETRVTWAGWLSSILGKEVLEKQTSSSETELLGKV